MHVCGVACAEQKGKKTRHREGSLNISLSRQKMWPIYIDPWSQREAIMSIRFYTFCLFIMNLGFSSRKMMGLLKSGIYLSFFFLITQCVDLCY